jgi:hypothetical protein
MVLPRTALPFLMVLLLAVFVVSCGDDDAKTASSDEPASPTTESSSAASGGDDAEPAPDPAAVEAARDKLAGSTAFAMTPELTACMTEAGFVQDAPPTGALAAWRHPDGARAVVAADGDTTLGIASEIGTAEFPAEVQGTTVVAGPAALVAAGSACLAG